MAEAILFCCLLPPLGAGGLVNFMTVSSQLRVVSVVCLCLLVMMMSSEAAAQTYHSGQNVQPVFEGWEQNPDGSFNMVFGYLNRNYE